MAGEPMNILLVDDDEPLLSSVGRALEASGYTVVGATTMQEALKLIESDEGESVDAIITDWDLGMLSEGNGPDLVYFMTGRIPICLWSGIKRMHVEGADLQITKRDIKELFAWLESLDG
jgi:CheY-like chemotaxis protein